MESYISAGHRPFCQTDFVHASFEQSRSRTAADATNCVSELSLFHTSASRDDASHGPCLVFWIHRSDVVCVSCRTCITSHRLLHMRSRCYGASFVYFLYSGGPASSVCECAECSLQDVLRVPVARLQVAVWIVHEVLPYEAFHEGMHIVCTASRRFCSQYRF